MHSTRRTFSKTHVRTRAAQAPGSIARDPAAPAAATEQRGEAAEAVESKASLLLTCSHQLSPAEGLAHGTCHPDARPGRPHGTGGGGRSTWNCRGEMAGHPLSDGSRPSADVWLGGWLVVLKGHGNRKALELWVNEDGAGRPRGGAAPPTPEPRQTLPTSAAAPRGPDGTPHSHGRARNWASRLRDSAKVPGHNGPPPALPSTETAKEPGRAPQAERTRDTEGRPCRDPHPPAHALPPHGGASRPGVRAASALDLAALRAEGSLLPLRMGASQPSNLPSRSAAATPRGGGGRAAGTRRRPGCAPQELCPHRGSRGQEASS